MFRRRAALPALAVLPLLVLGTHCGEHEIHFVETVNPSKGGNLAAGGASAGGNNASGGLSLGGIIGAGGKAWSRGGNPGFESGGASGGRSFGGSSFGTGGRLGNGGFQGTSGGRSEACYRLCADGICATCTPNSGGNSNGAGGTDASTAGTQGSADLSGGANSAGRGGTQGGTDMCRADLRCDPECHVCVECLVAADCAGRGQGPFKCDPFTQRCMLVCDQDKECPWFTPVCNNVRRVCVECNSRDDCGPPNSNWHCIDNVCQR